jgi:hypothetical protein
MLQRVAFVTCAQAERPGRVASRRRFWCAEAFFHRGACLAFELPDRGRKTDGAKGVADLPNSYSVEYM